MAIKRFHARRGRMPQTIYGGSGTNFVGANNKLRKYLTLLDEEVLIKCLCT